MSIQLEIKSDKSACHENSQEKKKKTTYFSAIQCQAWVIRYVVETAVVATASSGASVTADNFKHRMFRQHASVIDRKIEEFSAF